MKKRHNGIKINVTGQTATIKCGDRVYKVRFVDATKKDGKK